MALIGENYVRNVLIGKDYPNHGTMGEARNATNGDAFVLSADGTAPANGVEFMVGVKNFKGGITQYKLDPSKVTYGSSQKAVAAVPKVVTVPIGTPVAGELYRIAIEVQGVGSLSAEDFYIKEAFYKALDTDSEKIVDGLIKSLARNWSREQPQDTGTFLLTQQDATTVRLPQNRWFKFDKNTTDGTAAVVTLTMTAVATEDGNVKVTLNGTDYFVPVTAGGTTTTLAAEISDWINANTDYTAVPTTNAIAITSAFERVEAALAFSANGVSGVTATVAQTTPGVDGSVWQVVITEKTGWLADYYVTGKKTRTNLLFTVTAETPADSPVISVSGGTPAKGDGYSVRNMEEYLLGNRQDTFRGAGYPHNFPEHYDSELDATYHAVSLEYRDYGRDDEQVASKKQITIFVKEDIGTFTKTNALIADLNTAINGANGVVIPTLS
jgi:hypothetical protein